MKNFGYLNYTKEKIENKKSLLLNMDQEIYRELKMISGKNNVTMSSIVRKLIYNYIMDNKLKM